MKTYDVKCPICGTLNKNLYLEETDGWMECEKCHATTASLDFRKMKRIPVFEMATVTEVLRISC